MASHATGKRTARTTSLPGKPLGVTPAEAPVVFARACEMFILELTHRGWAHAEENKRRTLQKSDIAAAIARTEVFDFLVDIVPRDEAKDAEAAVAAGMPHPAAGMPAADMGYYYVPQQ
uniref:Nuclear transcription factor Y subunit C-2 n=1 Tax=Aegilops tauschii TaxID=37682 RepID=M8CCN9_AEGTA